MGSRNQVRQRTSKANEIFGAEYELRRKCWEDVGDRLGEHIVLSWEVEEM